jgi:hypothetical protein
VVGGVSERPPKLPFAATLVVRAAHELTLSEKLVWLEDHAFDRGPEGAYVSAASVAARWGGSIAPKTVENARNRLKLLGLHEKVERAGARNVFGWFATLPGGCAPVIERPSTEEIARLGRRLDDHIRRLGHPRLESGQTTLPIEDRPPSGGGSDHRPGSGVSRRGVGGRKAPPSALPSEAQLHPAVRQDGVGADAPEAEGGAPRLIDARPRAAVEGEGWEDLRRRLAERKRQAGSA